MLKKRVALIFGGQSEEHEVSIMTAREIVKAIDQVKYEINLFGIDREGYWQRLDGISDELRTLVFNHDREKITGEVMTCLQTDIDVAFPLLHGPYGEDGRIQGLLDMIGLKYTGCNLVSSALCMDKDYTKKLLDNIGVPVTRSLTFTRDEKYSIAEITEALGYPIFVKPVNLGSSVGISKVKGAAELVEAIENAFKYDSKVIVEEGINAREIECAVLGNENPMVSLLGEIIPSHEFYDYEAKYFDEGKSKLIIPAKLDDNLIDSIRDYARRAYVELGCSGLSRIDFFVERESGRVYLNEINTMPGFTPYSMYPLLMGNSGVDYGDLIDRLISLGLE